MAASSSQDKRHHKTHSTKASSSTKHVLFDANEENVVFDSPSSSGVRLSKRPIAFREHEKRLEIIEQRKALPIFPARGPFLDEFRKADNLVLVGETGSGKTTQIVQFLFESKGHCYSSWAGRSSPSNFITTSINEPRIAVTQPRRVAAISLAKRVGEEIEASAVEQEGSQVFYASRGDGGLAELQSKLKEAIASGDVNSNNNDGTDDSAKSKRKQKRKTKKSSKQVTPGTGTLRDLVGYRVRFEDSVTKGTVIKYVTDGMLLREAMLDPKLREYSTVILDEAHERTLHTDLLFAIVRRAQRTRRSTSGDPPLKLIVMSATLDAENFARYFEGKVLYVEGRQYPVTIMYTKEPEPDYLDATFLTVLQIHKGTIPGDILVFLPGQEDIEAVANLLIKAQRASSGGRQRSGYDLDSGEEEGGSNNGSDSDNDNDDRDGQKKKGRRRHSGEESALKDDDDEGEEEDASEQGEPMDPFIVACMYSALPPEKQMQVFEPAPEGVRKIILATNIAETSITINGIKFVVDCGLVKAKTFNPRTGMEALLITPISKAAARQRAGRAGREQSGYCYRLFTEETFDKLRDQTEPEIRRCSLDHLVLQLKALGIDDVLNFEYMDPPPVESLVHALEHLLMLGALDLEGKLSDPLGQAMAQFPLAPMYGKTLFLSKEYGCTHEVLMIISLLSTESVFHMPFDKRAAAEESKKKFISRDGGDQLTLLNVFLAYLAESPHKRPSFCRHNFINERSMKKAVDIREQLADYCSQLGLDPNSSCWLSSDLVRSTEAIRKCFLAGFFMHTAIKDPSGTFYKTVIDNKIVHIHPTSVLFHVKPSCVVYADVISTSKQYMRDVLPIQEAWMQEILPKYRKAVSKSSIANTTL